jgi:hypothetical protein
MLEQFSSGDLCSPLRSFTGRPNLTFDFCVWNTRIQGNRLTELSSSFRHVVDTIKDTLGIGSEVDLVKK